MAWCRPGNKPLSEPVMVRLPMHICVTRPQWANPPMMMIWNLVFTEFFFFLYKELKFGTLFIFYSATANDLDPNNVTVAPTQEGGVQMKWMDPPMPNGLIVTYEIEFWDQQLDNVSGDVALSMFPKINSAPPKLINRGWMTHWCISKLGHQWFK